MEAPDFNDKSTWPVECSATWKKLERDSTCDEEFWENDRYWVKVQRGLKSPWGGEMIRLGIQNIDQTARHDWRDFQRIKNDICGPESEAVELYPAESRLLDPSNYFMLWVFAKTVPVGVFGKRSVCGESLDVPQRAFPSPPAGHAG